MGKTSQHYDDTKYVAAANKYNDLADQYTGKKGQETASAQARTEASNSSATAAATAKNNALNAGYSRAKAARMGQAEGAKQYNTAYQNGYNNAVAMNNAAMTAKANDIQTQANIANKKYDVKNQDYNNTMDIVDKSVGAAGGILSGVAGMMSDENCKEITMKTSAERCDELLAKLRGN